MSLSTPSLKKPHGCFLVTSLGAYDDSGVGTGGFTCLHEGEATIVDHIDSTGLCVSDGIVYRFARGLRCIIGYSREGVVYTLALRGLHDVHDISLRKDEFVCVATGTNEVVWVDLLGRIIRRWQAAGEGDAWHLNCLEEKDGRLFLCAFGRFSSHREWTKGGCLRQGVIFDLETERDEVTGLSGPHNPRWVDGEWVVCDSHVSALVLQRPGSDPRRVNLRGFTRGLAHDADYFYVGESANRKSAVPELHSNVAVIDRQTLEVVNRYQVPFPEIYELAMVEPELSQAFSERPQGFQVGGESERLRQTEGQVEICTAEIYSLRQRLERLSTLERLNGQLVAWKRRLIG